MEKQHPKYVLDRPPFRFVMPYPHIFQTHAKQRWYNKPLLQTLCKQFKAYNQDYFRQAINSHKIKINNKPTHFNYKIKNGDFLTHQTIRQQPPILNLSIDIIANTQQFVVVDKPPSFIVHTGGGYHYNTLLSIMQHDMGFKNLYILHRLDRLTSGLILLSRNKQKATKFHEQSSNQLMKKMYYARVSGNFPFQAFVLNAPIVCLSHKQGVFSVYDSDSQQHRQAANKNNGIKQSKTKFVKVYYDPISNSSLIECYPITGRTHQIRVHLQYIGNPILNDQCYNGYFVGNGIIEHNFKNIKLKRQKQDESSYKNQQIRDQIHKKRILDAKIQQKQEQQIQLNEKQSLISDELYNKWDFHSKSWQICLHSYRYIFEGKQYYSKKPYWVQKQAIKTQCQQFYPKRYFEDLQKRKKHQKQV